MRYKTSFATRQALKLRDNSVNSLYYTVFCVYLSRFIQRIFSYLFKIHRICVTPPLLSKSSKYMGVVRVTTSTIHRVLPGPSVRVLYELWVIFDNVRVILNYDFLILNIFVQRFVVCCWLLFIVTAGRRSKHSWRRSSRRKFLTFWNQCKFISEKWC